jgi:hypothetical protein
MRDHNQYFYNLSRDLRKPEATARTVSPAPDGGWRVKHDSHRSGGGAEKACIARIAGVAVTGTPVATRSIALQTEIAF